MFLVRHGQSEFNKHFSRTHCDPGIVDPEITDLGREQARQAGLLLATQHIHTILSSPFTRALQTATIIAERLHLPIRIEPLVRERGAFVCDIGTPRSKLEQAWPHLDFGGVPEIWWDDEAETPASVGKRAAAFRARMLAAADRDGIVVVSHWGFILALTGRAVENGTVVPFDPCEPGGA